MIHSRNKMASVGGLESEAAKRKERLKALRQKKQGNVEVRNNCITSLSIESFKSKKNYILPLCFDTDRHLID